MAPTSSGADFMRGIVPSMNTPFLADGSIDVDGIVRTAEAVVQAGVAGMLVLAVAGETGSLDAAEKRLVASTFLRQGFAKAVNARLGRRIIHLAVRTGLAIDGADIDDASKTTMAHTVDDRTAHIKARA